MQGYNKAFAFIRERVNMLNSEEFTPELTPSSNTAVILDSEKNSQIWLAFIDDVRTWVIENREEARSLSNTIRELTKQAALDEKKAA